MDAGTVKVEILSDTPEKALLSDHGFAITSEMKPKGTLVRAIAPKQPNLWAKNVMANVHELTFEADDSLLRIVAAGGMNDHIHINKTFTLATRDGSLVRLEDRESSLDDGQWVVDCGAPQAEERTATIRFPDGWTSEWTFTDDGSLLSKTFKSGLMKAIRAYNKNMPWELLPKVNDALDAGDTNKARRYFERIPKGRSFARYDALILRKEGEILETEGKLEDAIAAWTKALEIDDKVGVKRKLASARKRLVAG